MLVADALAIRVALSHFTLPSTAPVADAFSSVAPDAKKRP